MHLAEILSSSQVQQLKDKLGDIVDAAEMNAENNYDDAYDSKDPPIDIRWITVTGKELDNETWTLGKTTRGSNGPVPAEGTLQFRVIFDPLPKK